MTANHWQTLIVYLSFTLAATLLALARRRLRPGAGGESVWRKYPSYILINLGFLAASWAPPAWHILTALLALLGGLAAWEIARALLFPAPAQNEAAPTLEPYEKILVVLLPCTTVLLIAASDLLSPAGWINIGLFMFLFFTAANTLTGRTSSYARRALAVAGCVVYLPACIAAYIWVRQMDTSGFHAVFLYLAVATNDALAQITGQLLGGRQLAPHISPAKTVEGAAGGVLFATALGAVLSGIMGWSYPLGAMLGLALGLAGLAGDLTASAWKRALGLKNFSALLGAQGGVLDRFDGLIFAAPVFYLLMTWLGK